MIIRKANIKDIPFLVDTIIEAEKSGTNIISYCEIFEISEELLRNYLESMLEEDIEGQEICVGSFLVAEEDGEVAGAIAGWIEGEEGISSSLLKANLLSFYIPQENLIKAQQKQSIIQATHINREKDSIQIESGYVNPKHRGKGVIRKLIDAQIQRFENKNASKAQIIVAANNEKAIHSYEKIRFFKVLEKNCTDNKVYKLLPSDTNALLEKNLRENV